MIKYFNPRSPYGERLVRIYFGFFPGHFNPRSPYGERQSLNQPDKLVFSISIHAPLTGSDPFFNRFSPCWVYFNPRSPYGERHAGREASLLG